MDRPPRTPRRAAPASANAATPPRITSSQFFGLLQWIDGRPLLDTIEPYRRRIFAQALDEFDDRGRPKYNLILCGRAKKNFKTADLCLAALFALCANDSPGGNQVYVLANDEGQAGDDLELVKKIVVANAVLASRLTVQRKTILRNDGKGALEILPAKDIAGAHGKTYRFCGFDEIWGYKNWDVLEALAFDPTRPDSQQWITSYASIYHKPGVPLFDLTAAGWRGSDPRMLFSWYAADRTTDPDLADADPESRANPSRGSHEPDYLESQRRRLPAHRYRRLHLNLPGLPEGAAYKHEVITEVIERDVVVRLPEPTLEYHAFVDMSGGSNDDAVLAVGYRDAAGRGVLARVANQGQPPPFDPRTAVERFVAILREYRVGSVTGDRYAGETFRRDFERAGIDYDISDGSKSDLYEAFEPHLNSHHVVLLDVPILEQQLLSLVWRGGKIDHPPGEHDDWANAVVGCLTSILTADSPAPELVFLGDASDSRPGVEALVQRQGFYWPGR